MKFVVPLHESTSQQLRLVEPPETSVHAVGKPVEDDKRPVKECYKCGRKHAFFKRELCPAFGKTCNRCHKPNHFAVKCRQKSQVASVKVVEEQNSDEEVYHTSALTADADDTQLVTLKLESGNFCGFKLTREPNATSFLLICTRKPPMTMASRRSHLHQPRL